MLSLLGGTTVDVIPVITPDTDPHHSSLKEGGISVADASNGSTVVASHSGGNRPSPMNVTGMVEVTKGVEKMEEAGLKSVSGAAAGAAAAAAATGGGIFAGKKILVVDDAISILKLMSHTLSSKGQAIVTQAKDGQEALDECEKQVFDLILTDIQMPVLDGFGEARSIRAREKENNLDRKIIVGISANGQDRIAIEAEEAGMDAFMNKPFKLDDLTIIYPKILECRQRELLNVSLKSTGDDTTVVPRMIKPITTNAKIFVARTVSNSGESTPTSAQMSPRSSYHGPSSSSSPTMPFSGTSFENLNRSDRLNLPVPTSQRSDSAGSSTHRDVLTVASVPPPPPSTTSTTATANGQ